MLDFVQATAKDKSWRIRFTLAEKIVDTAKLLGPQHLLPIFVEFLQDQEGEVKVAATNKAAEFCKLLDSQTIITNILPHLTTLSKDPIVYVRRTLLLN
jgi:serine/threonine-protein phosphatase 2A regulatory subunit A